MRTDWLALIALAGGLALMSQKSWAPPKRANKYLPAIYSAEEAHGMPRNLLARVLHQESRFREDIVSGETKSGAGALGIAQFMPATAASLEVDPLDPFDAIHGAAEYLANQRKRFGSWHMALAAYNWGPGNLATQGLHNAPAETRDYVAQITSDVEGL